MVRTRSRIYSTYILLLDKSLLFHERFVSRSSLGLNIADSTIAKNEGIAVDADYDEMISELIDEFPILRWRKFLLNCLIDEIVTKNNKEVTNTIPACRGLYYYGFPGEKQDEALFSTQYPNTRGMFLTRSLRNVIERSDTYYPMNINGGTGICETDQIMKLIEHCRIKNNWGSLSFFDNTLREIVFMDYLLTQRKIIVEDNIMRHRHRNWFLLNIYKAYAKDEISVLSPEKLILKINLVSENRYLRDSCFEE